MITFWSRFRFMHGFNELPPWFYQPNCTDWYQPVMVYMLACVYGHKNILEIGVAEGYGMWHLANAAKQNNGHYWGIDIVDVWNRVYEPYGIPMQRYMEGEMLPITFIQADTKELKELPMPLLDLVYIDGEHKTDTILHEVYDLIMPKMRKDGFGYICFDDVIDQGAQGAWAIIQKDPQFETLTFLPNGGFGMARIIKQQGV